MSQQVTYREYTISSVPVKLVDKNEWKPEIEISSQRDGIVTSKPYTEETTYSSEEVPSERRTSASVHPDRSRPCV